MRKALLAATLAIATMTTAVSAADISLELKGGLNIAKSRVEAWENEADTTDGYDINPRLGFVAGVGAQIGITEMFAIQPEILFSRKGAIQLEEGTDVENGTSIKYEEKQTFNLSYLEIPILFKLNIPVGEKITPNVYVGPTASFLLAADIDQYDKEGSEEHDTTITDVITGWDNDGNPTLTPLKDEMQGFDFGLAFGGGVNINVGSSGYIITDFRYTLGLTDMNSDKRQDAEGYKDEDKAKNGALSIMLGYGIKF